MFKGQVASLEGIFIDHVSDLTSLDRDEYLSGLSDASTPATIVVRPGGTAVEFAVAAHNVGFRPSCVIGKIGGVRNSQGIIEPDSGGSSVIKYLGQNNVQGLVAHDENHPTGKTVIVYFASGHRMMLSDPSANSTFAAKDVTPEMLAAVRQAGLIHFSGFALLSQNAREAVLRLINDAKKTGNPTVVLDLVPHKFYQWMPLQQLATYVKGIIDWIFVELASAHQLVGLGPLRHETVDEHVISTVLSLLHVIFPTVAMSLSPGEFTISDNGVRFGFKSRETLPLDITQLGYTARVQAELLFWYFTQSG